MNRERWQLLQRLLEEARERPDAQREGFVRAGAGADVELAEEVLRVLASEPASLFLTPPPHLPPLAAMPRRLGDLELLEELGRGRFGAVYRARELTPPGRIVAVKVLTPTLTMSARDADRFSREPQTVARLHHPNIVPILRVGEEQGERFFVMELIAGPTLADEIRRLRDEHVVGERSSANLPSSRAGNYFRSVAELVRQIADGLSYAHQNGVVHRDVKPGNLMLDVEGHARIVDFGLARDEEQGSITKSDAIGGTPHYMSPEQASGFFHRVDQRTDVYSLGVVLYELLSLKRPFGGGSTPEILRNIREQEPVPLRRHDARIPPELAIICAMAMAKERDERYANAAQMRDDLACYLAQRPLTYARRPSPWTHARRRLKKHRRAVTIAAVSVLLGSGVGFLFSSQVHGGALEQEAGALQALLDEGPLENLPPGRQSELVERTRALRGAGSLPSAAEAILVRAETAGAELCTRLLEQADADLAAAATEQRSSKRESLRLQGLMRLWHLRHLFPDDERVQARSGIEAAYPRISIRAEEPDGSPAPAQVFVREVDVFTSTLGPALALGRTPLVAPLLPGYYRVIVRFDAGGSRELLADPGSGFLSPELVAHRRADEGQPAQDMLRFEACDYTFPASPQNPFADQTVHLDAFWLDRTEVSNGEYRRFLEERPGHAQPFYWTKYGYQASYDALPVMGLTYTDVLAFCEWIGKRLPTAAEWQRAYGGLENRTFPYSSDPAEPPRGVVGHPDTLVIDHDSLWDAYLRFVAPVTGHPEASTPEGLLNMYGNVEEWTESVMVDLVPPTARPADRIFYGGGWNAIPIRARTPSYEGIGSQYFFATLGFRCARSDEP